MPYGLAGALTNMLIRCTLFLCINLFALVSAAHSSENFNIRGLQLGMTKNQFRSTFENIGYKCKMVDGAYFDCEGPETEFKANWARMFLDDQKRARSLLIRCGVTDSCQFNVDEIVSILKISGRFPPNVIEIKVDEEETGYRRKFTTPKETMSINCHWWGAFDECDIKISAFSLYPKF